MIPQVRDLLSVATKKIDFLNSFALLTPLSSDGVKKRIVRFILLLREDTDI